MARSREMTQKAARKAASSAGIDQGQAPREAVDVAAVVQAVMHSSFGNALVNAALNGADTSALGQALASEIAAATAGMGPPTGSALESAGNSAVSKVLAAQAATAGEQGMTQAQALNELRGGQGIALPDAVRGRMEKAFGRSFAGVRVHIGDRSAAAAEALNAQAVAMGSHIHFAAGQYAPGTQAGDAVIAHELTHVVQAMEGRLPGSGGVSNTSMAAEREAYGNESLASGGSLTGLAGGFGTDSGVATVDSVGHSGLSSAPVGPSSSVFSPAPVMMASSVDTAMAPSSMAPLGSMMGSLPSLGLGMPFGSVGPMASLSMAPMSMGPMASAPMAAAASAPAMLRENPTRQEASRETDSEASIRHEMAMGMKLGFRRSIDASEGNAASVAKEGSGRVDGVFHGPAKTGHLAVEEYMKVMKDVSPTGERTRGRSDDNIRDSAMHTQTENDGHAHLDGDHRLGARPETTATPPGGDPVMGGPGGDMRKGGEAGPGKGSPVRAAPGKPKI